MVDLQVSHLAKRGPRRAGMLAAVALATLGAAAAPRPADAAILDFFGFGFSKSKYYQDAQYWVRASGQVIGLAALFGTVAPEVGAVLLTGAMIARIIDPETATIISGRATIDLSPGETFVQAGWYGEFGADPLLPAPMVGSATVSETLLQADCNPLMVSCSASYDAMAHRVVVEFDWGNPGFSPTLNMNSTGHFNFAAVYTLSATPNVPFGMVGTRADVAELGTAAPTYMLCNGNYCGATVPEPGTLALMITGLGAMGMLVRTRRRRPADLVPSPG
jgi:hypothetical protein